jgi:3-deoxy-manno-octulosonate cytidylyltransferase (CMP-KDO synthetase)
MKAEDMKTVIVIPARYGSSRLPGKPLADILGKPMVQHVYERACQVPMVSAVLVATDDARIHQAVLDFGGQSLITSSSHASGTDRLVEVMAKVEADVYVNVQGDEPMLRPADVALIIEAMRADVSIEVGTLCHEIDVAEAQKPNSVKVVTSHQGDALYFSRSAIPFNRDAEATSYLKHIGVYAYRRNVLQSYSQLPASHLEQAEQLEQLRLLAAGIRVRTLKVDPTGPGVDTPACLERVRALMSGQPSKPEDPLADVRLVICDVDGVLTDGGLYYAADGENLKRFHARDGLGISMLQACGIGVAIVSGRDCPALRRRVAELGIRHAQYQVKDKAQACRQLQRQLDLKPEQVAFIGDDSIDLPAFAACGWSFAVADAPLYVRQAAQETLTRAGGQGALREVSDRILTARGQHRLFDSAEGWADFQQSCIQ